MFLKISVLMPLCGFNYVDKNDISKVVRHWKSRPYRQGDFRELSPASSPVFASVTNRHFNAAFRFSGDYEYMLRAFIHTELNHSICLKFWF